MLFSKAKKSKWEIRPQRLIENYQYTKNMIESIEVLPITIASIMIPKQLLYAKSGIKG